MSYVVNEIFCEYGTIELLGSDGKAYFLFLEDDTRYNDLKIGDMITQGNIK